MKNRRCSRIIVWALCLAMLISMSTVNLAYAIEQSGGASGNVIFDLDCSNLQTLRDAGWIINNPQEGLYTNDSLNSFDNDVDNPDGVEMESVPEGQFLMVGDSSGSNDGVGAFKKHMMDADLIANKLDDKGMWYLEFNARFDDLVKVSGYPAERGFSFFVDTGVKVYRVTFTRDNKVLVKNGTYGQYVSKNVDLHLGDLQFHKWAISYVGDKGISIVCDGKQVAFFSDIDVPASIGSWGQPGVHIINAPLDVLAGINKVYFDSVKFVVNEMAEGAVKAGNALFEDDCSSLTGSGWTVSEAKTGVYITDNTHSNGIVENIKSVDAGQYLIYGDNTATSYVAMSRSVDIGEGPWELQFDAVIKDLVTASNYKIYRGLSFEIFANGNEYKITFNDQNKILAMTNASSGTYIEQAVNMPTDNAFHKWAIASDGESKVFVKLDGEVVATFEGVAIPTTVADCVKILNAPLQWARGCTEVYLNNISMVKTGESVIFNDDCSNLVDAGWIAVAPWTGAYITDASISTGNPNNAVMETVPAGQYLIYGDKTGNDTRKYVYMTKPLNIGEGPWELQFDALIKDLVTANNYQIYRGMSFEIFANGSEYKITFNDQNKILAMTNASSGTYIEQAVNMPTDNAFHKWAIACDGESKVFVKLDGEVVAAFEGIIVPTTAADCIKILNAPLQWERGCTDVYLDNIRMIKKQSNVNVDPNLVFDDDCSSLVDGKWIAGAPKQGAYITDHNQSSGSIAGMIPVEEGQYLIYGDGTASGYVAMSRSIKVGDVPWALEFDARIVDLMTPSANFVYRGFGLDITVGGKRYMITLNDKNKIVTPNKTIAVNMPSPDEFHQWGIAYDGKGKVIIAIDGKKVASLENIATSTAAADVLIVKTVPLNYQGGKTEVYLDNIKMVKNILPEWTKYDPYFYGCTVLPTSSSESINIVAATSDVNPEWFADQNVVIKGSLYKDNQLVAQSTEKLDGEFVDMSINSNGVTGRMTLVLQLMNGSTKVTEIKRNVEVNTSLSVLQPGQNVTAEAGNVYMFTQLDEMKDLNDKDIMTAGWRPSTFTYDGLNQGGIVLENLENAKALKVPAQLNGWFGVYVGYVTGTEEFKVSDGTQEQTLVIVKEDETDEDAEPVEEYGQKLICETFALASNFNDTSVSIAPSNGRNARIAYIKFKALTAEEIALYEKPDEGENGNRVIYNNDGYSDFFQGYYSDEETLKELVVDRYMGQDVGSIDWCLGTTFMLNYNSQYAGIPYATLTPEQEAALMRDGDKRARDQILGFINQGKNPLQIVAARAEELGMKTNASLRMSAFYDPATYPWLNGNNYNDYLNCRYVNKDGTIQNRISYAYPEFREYIKNILKEVASVEYVDGVNLDFCRYPYVLGYEPVLIDAYIAAYGVDPKNETSPEGLQRWNQFKADIMTDFMREIRQELSGKTISVRVPYVDYFEYGLDIQKWVNEGLIDVLIPSHIGHEEFFDVTPFVSIVNGSNVKLYGGINGTLSGHDLTKAEEDAIKRGQKINLGHAYVSAQQYQLRAYEMYQAGYDGLYIFNNWKGNDSLGLLGDKVKVEKWYGLAYSSEWVQNLVTVNPAISECLSDIKVNGAALEGFEASQGDYTVVLPYKTTEVPAVTVIAVDPNATVEITPVASLPGATTIKVTAGNGVTSKIYTVTFEVEDVSIQFIRQEVDDYVTSGDLQDPLVAQLTNALDQAEHQLSIDLKDHAIKHMEDFLKHLDNKALAENVSESAKEVLTFDANALIELWQE